MLRCQQLPAGGADDIPVVPPPAHSEVRSSEKVELERTSVILAGEEPSMLEDARKVWCGNDFLVQSVPPIRILRGDPEPQGVVAETLDAREKVATLLLKVSRSVGQKKL
jgi:hypothetical protein